MDELGPSQDKATQTDPMVLAFNSGSSSLKFGLYKVHPFAAVLSGEAEWRGGGAGIFRAIDGNGKQIASEASSVDQRTAMVRITRLLDEQNMSPPVAIGHRIVHGGAELRNHTLIDDSVLRQLEGASVFASLHVPGALSIVRSAQERFPGIPQAACLDTAFHAGLPDVARLFALPKAIGEEGVFRFGFHGLSCESIVAQLGRSLPERVVIAHLGNGASITAVREGGSIDTTMGLTPTGGVIMGTRCGDLDPGVLVYLLREKNLDAAEVEDLVDRRSGLLGISGISSDMRILQQAAASDRGAALAIEMFCYSVRKHIAAMAAALGGIDMLIFTGGIGEHAPDIRRAICSELSFLGIVLDAVSNGSSEVMISAHSPCAVHVLPSKEDEQIVRHTWNIARHVSTGLNRPATK